MKILIEISEEDYLGIKDPDRLTAYWANIRAKEAIRKGTPIPDNATNGDVIKAMFPSNKGELKDTSDKVLAYILDDLFMLYLSDYWWKKPYKEERNANDS